MTTSICPCDGVTLISPTNLPELSHIAYRVGTYRDFRRAILTPVAGEQVLSDGQVLIWRPDGAGDLAVMMAEWFAYLADILTFYNERIANQDYLRTADLPESVSHLIKLLGYRPRPAIGAVGTLAALVTPGQRATLPQGLQFQSKPAPGQAPQIFELLTDTSIVAPDAVPAIPPPVLLAEIDIAVRRADLRLTRFGGATAGGGFVLHIVEYSLLLQGAVTTIDPGALLVLRPRDPSLGNPSIATVSKSVVQPAPGGGQQTALTFSLSAAPSAGLAAAQASLDRANQIIGLWSFFGGAIDGTTVHLASLARQIRPNDWVMLSGASGAPAPALFQVNTTAETIWDATGSKDNPGTASDTNHPVPVPHTVLILTAAPDADWGNDPGSVTVSFAWISVGSLLNQPFAAWPGSPTALIGTSAIDFVDGSGLPILLQDANGAGIVTTGTSSGDTNLQLGTLPAPSPSLQPPFMALYNLLPVTRGKTVSKEVLGSGDATVAGQRFTLSQSPVTYLAQGSGYASTIALTVNGQPWTEVASFYGQPANAQIFVTGETDDGQTYVEFGDGANGARVPTGLNNIAVTYRIGAGAASPPAGKLTVIAKSFPGLRSVLNPVAVGGGADPDPPAQIRAYAPRSVLTFGRAVSVFDYQALAAQAPGVARAGVAWAWDDSRQRTVVKVFVGDNMAAVASATTVLAAAGDPNRPIKVVQATAIVTSVALVVVAVPGMDTGAIIAGIVTALADPQAGLFAAGTLPVGQPVFNSQIEQAVLAVPGTIAIAAATFTANGAVDPGPLHNPGEGGYFDLTADAIHILTEPAPHG